MKKIIFCMLVSVILSACNQSPSANSSVTREAKALYEQNLAVVKSVVNAFENEQIDALAATIADSAVWTTAAYGSVPGTKADWMKALSSYMADWDSLKLVEPLFLPGLNLETFEIDGTVRYYGHWTGVHKSGLKTDLSFYAAYQFNKDHKIVNASEFYDLGGLINAVSAAKPK